MSEPELDLPSLDTMSDGAILTWLGTDARRWAEAFERHDRPEDPDRLGGLISWFANALEAGRDAGRRELCPHTTRVKLAGGLTLCGTCGRRLE